MSLVPWLPSIWYCLGDDEHLAACLFSCQVVCAAPLFTMPSVDDDLDEGNHSDGHMCICDCQYLAVAKLHDDEGCR